MVVTRAAVASALRVEPGARGAQRARRAYLAVASVGVGIHAGFALAGARSPAVDDWLYCGLFYLAAAACAYRGWRGVAAGAWRVAAIGVAVWGLAEIVFRLETSAPHALYPPATRVLLFVAFSLAYTTLIL